MTEKPCVGETIPGAFFSYAKKQHLTKPRRDGTIGVSQ